MPPLKIDLNSVEQRRREHNGFISQVSQAANDVSSKHFSIDSAITARRNLHYRITIASNRLRKLEQQLTEMSDFMRSAIENYGSTEDELKHKVSEIIGHKKSLFERLTDGIGDAFDAFSTWLSTEDGKRMQEYMRQNAVAPPNSCSPPEEPIDYRAYLGEYDRDTPGVDALYFIDANGKRMQVDFSKLEQLVGEYYYVSNLMLIPGQVLYLTDANFTDFYNYAITQGYDPRTFQPIDLAEEENIQNYILGRLLTHEMYRQEQKVLGSLVLDLLPVIGQVKSAIELWKGENLVTGEELNGWDYGFGIVGAIAPGIKGGRGLYKGYKALTAVDEVVDVSRVIEGAGDLKYNKISETPADDVNKWWKEEMNYTEPPYKPDTLTQEIELTEKSTFVRVFDEENSGMYGGWFMKADDIKGLTPLQIQNKFALPTIPKFVVDVELDAGTRIRTGTANPLFGFGGGGQQFDLIGQRVGNFTNPRPLP